METSPTPLPFQIIVTGMSSQVKTTLTQSVRSGIWASPDLTLHFHGVSEPSHSALHVKQDLVENFRTHLFSISTDLFKKLALGVTYI